MSGNALSVRGGGEAPPRLLLVDDDPLILELWCRFFEDGHEVVAAQNREESLSALAQNRFDLAAVDLGLPPAAHRPDEGFAVVREILARQPGCAVVVVSGQDASRHALRARALGAMDYVTKPCDPPTLAAALTRAARLHRAGVEAMGLVGESPPMAELRETIRRAAASPFAVLVEGETGTGKELIARAIHARSRAGRPFVAVNCAAVPPHLVEPTLFGHARGAFTGAQAAAGGYFGDAADGTLFLDEVGDLPAAVQGALLRALETGEYRRVGESRYRALAARVVSASNRPLAAAARAGKIREDLYHRLSVLAIQAPPLRALGDDRFALLEKFTAHCCEELNAPPFSLNKEARALWASYRFPGNVRELRNIVARLAVNAAGSEVDAAGLAAQLAPAEGGAEFDENARGLIEWRHRAASALAAGGTLKQHLARAEFALLAEALAAADGDFGRAAKSLGVSSAEFEEKMRRLDGAAAAAEKESAKDLKGAKEFKESKDSKNSKNGKRGRS